MVGPHLCQRRRNESHVRANDTISTGVRNGTSADHADRNARVGRFVSREEDDEEEHITERTERRHGSSSSSSLLDERTCCFRHFRALTVTLVTRTSSLDLRLRLRTDRNIRTRTAVGSVGEVDGSGKGGFQLATKKMWFDFFSPSSDT
jgi:hypothetical protein